MKPDKDTEKPWQAPGTRDDEVERLRLLLTSYERLVEILSEQNTILRIELEKAASFNAAAAEYREAARMLSRVMVGLQAA